MEESHEVNLTLTGNVPLGGNSQNFFRIILKNFVTLSRKILLLLRLKEVFETDILKCWG